MLMMGEMKQSLNEVRYLCGPPPPTYISNLHTSPTCIHLQPRLALALSLVEVPISNLTYPYRYPYPYPYPYPLPYPYP